MQLVVNISLLIGIAMGMLLGSINDVVKIYILGFVAGDFIYIGADIWRNLIKNKSWLANVL